MPEAPTHLPELTDVAHRARMTYARCVAGGGAYVPWWTAVIVTASSARQAERYRDEIARRRQAGKVPPGVRYLVAPDLDDARIGSGGATLNALRLLAEEALPGADAASLEAWWATQRVLIVHSGGDSRRLPQYSLSGKLFSALPVRTPWGEVSTVFDETLALSTAWADRLDAGVVVGSGDVILTFDAAQLDWRREGVSGVAMRAPVAVGSKHGVYIAGDAGRVYAFLQKPTAAEVDAAGGLLPAGDVALDSGLMYLDAPVAARLTALAGVARVDGAWTFGAGVLAPGPSGYPMIDLYEHITLMLTGQWTPAPDAEPRWHILADALRGVPFWCDLVDGEFTHVGTTTLFRQLMTEETNFSRLYEVRQRLGVVTPPGMRSAGVIIDSVFAAGGTVGAGAIAIECDLAVPVQIGRGAIVHGLAGVSGTIDAPEDVVIHQVPLATPDGRRSVIIRVYGVADDPKGDWAAGTATWFGEPFADVLARLGITPEQVWPGVPEDERTLWNADLFPGLDVARAWACACWMMGRPSDFTSDDWAKPARFSLATSAQWADSQALAEARTRRQQATWEAMAVSLALSGSDIRPLLAHAPGLAALASTGRALCGAAAMREAGALTDAASLHYHANRFLAHAGLAEEAAESHAAAFRCVRRAVDAGVPPATAMPARGRWAHAAVRVAAPARIDLGGGWSDTPPFCLDWGGTVLNMALALGGEYPIVTTARRIDEPVLRCISEDNGDTAEYHTTAEVMAPPAPGDPFAIPRVALRMMGAVGPDEPLERALAEAGGGLELRTAVRLPMGSGLGTSSILAATVLRALAEMRGTRLGDAELCDQVMRLEQMMTTGGGWQDQAGGVFPGAKLVMSGPGLRQRLRVEPIEWSPEREREFADRLVLYYTGIRRIAKNLLAQVVGSYLAREVETVQVLHSIKTLATEMSYAMREGEWGYLGDLLDRHWRLNMVLDPNTTNAPINALLEGVRPYIAGAKLAGAGGGGFLILLARDPDAAAALRAHLTTADLPGTLYDHRLAGEGLRVEYLAG